MKAVFFDFDGTLTYKSKNIWKTIWQQCNYDTDNGAYYSKLLYDYFDKKITYQEWCDLTCERFTKAGFCREELIFIANDIHILDGALQTLNILKQAGYRLHIISGNISNVIKHVFDKNTKLFDSINANEFIFDNKGILSKIQGTNYDFEGKARFIEEYKQKTKSNADELIFVGNGDNDEYVHLSGCKTICINPDNTDSSNRTKWHISKDNVTNLTDILPLIDRQLVK